MEPRAMQALRFLAQFPEYELVPVKKVMENLDPRPDNAEIDAILLDLKMLGLVETHSQYQNPKNPLYDLVMITGVGREVYPHL